MTTPAKSPAEKRKKLSATQELIRAAKVVLDCVDYTNGACGAYEMVGAVLPKEQITQLRAAIVVAEIGRL